MSISMLTTILELDCGENPISAGGGQAKGVQDACQSVARQVAPSIACIQPARGTRRECRAPRARTRSRSGVSSARRSSGARAARRLKQRRGPPKSASSGGGPPAAAPGAARLPILRRARHLSGVWRPGGCSWYAQHAQRCVAPARTRATAAFVATPCYCASCRECSTQWLRTVSVLWLHVAELLDAARAWQSGMQRAAWRQEGSKGGVVISVRRNRRVGRRARAARFLIHRTCR